MRIGVAGDLMSVFDVEGTHLVRAHAVRLGVRDAARNQIERRFHAVFAEKRSKTSILCAAVVIAERKRVPLAVLISVKFNHDIPPRMKNEGIFFCKLSYHKSKKMQYPMEKLLIFFCRCVII